MENYDLKEDKLTLEVLVHFVDKNGQRIKPAYNRIQIPLRVSNVIKDENTMIVRYVTDSICSCLASRPVLQRLVLDPDKAEKLEEKYGNVVGRYLASAVLSFCHDCIEIQDVPHTYL